MDPTLQEFYSLSRSASQERPMSELLSTSHSLRPSRSSSRQQHHQDRPASANVYAWSHYRPMSVPSIAQIYLQPNYQPSNQEALRPGPGSSHQRHHTSGSTPDYSYRAAATETQALSNGDGDSTQTDPQGFQSQHDPSIYTANDENNAGTSNDQHAHVERLEDLDDYGPYSANQRPQSNAGPYNNYSNDGLHGEDMDGDRHDERSMLLTPQKPTPTPLPRVPLFVLSIVIFSDPLTSTILFPFVYFMVWDFHLTDNEDEIGFFCGLIASSFFFAQFCTSIFWGYMSDRYGRRPILLFGLCGSTIACIFFGLSKSLAWAIISRSMCGLLNGNVGVAKSMLGEIADHTNQSQAFSIFGFAWGIGMIVGPVLGGYLANPAKTFPDIFGNWAFFIEYPYFLPCFVAAMGSVVGFIVGYFFLEETKGRKNTAEEEAQLQEDDVYSDSYQNDDQEMEEGPSGTNQYSQLAKPTGTNADATATASTDVDLERQSFMMTPSMSQPQQVKSGKRRNLGRSQYGSMMTLALDTRDNGLSQHIPDTYTSISARSTLSRRVNPTRTSNIPERRLSVSVIDAMGRNYVERSIGSRYSSFYASRPLSSGGIFSGADPFLMNSQGVTTIPADATSLSLYGYMMDDHDDPESGRRNRMSVAPSQVFVLPPDPENKDPNQPVQLFVVQSDTGLSPLSITTIVAYAMLALHTIIFEEVYTLYTVTPLASHGLGWDAIQLSTSLACMGLVQLFLQFVVYPKLERRFSAVWLFRCAQLMYVCVYLSLPMIRAFAVDEEDTETGGQIPRVRYLVLTVLVFKYFCSVFSYTSIMVMITNSSPPHLLGTINGIGQTSASFMRAFGPALGGILWAWSLSNKLSFPFNYFFVFFLIGMIAIMGFIHSLSIPRDLGQ
ncbi:major facilitator superfamily domain-containing protein [Gamsiella multidivaricata]|uniref:major facilitator superfamily domain-containing protein n=1 Tax=Gamsiella multidivaricata TaxID=101098 RepID=UPI00221F4D5E|nr:major facilitator superfamily domain-containing protein [Gamsiella multidivaricata]KAI7828538.1 major facilitator superfamily domain-containing protein [Gamsiella multidivaricata]